MSNSNLKSPSQFFGRGRIGQKSTLGLLRVVLGLGMMGVGLAVSAHAQTYVGALGGVATLSGDAKSVLSPGGSSFSSYSPRNGFALEMLVGRHLSDSVSVQAEYRWNRNSMAVTSGAFAAGTQEGYQEIRNSLQQGVVADVLVYVRRRDSRFRPYLSVGAGFVHFSSTRQQLGQVVGSPALPRQSFSANKIALHVPVGMDVRLRRGWAFRYTFSETLSGNPINEGLTPRPSNRLKNFQSLFGIVKQF